MFPARRVHPYLPYRRADDNIFYPALIAFTLEPLLGRLLPKERLLAEQIIAGVRSNFSAYESQRQPGLYNFYRTRPPSPYPNGWLLHRFKHFRLAEDADDTVMISTLLEDLAKDRIDWLREELVRFSNLQGKRLFHPLSEYAAIPAHGVWLGTGAMPVEVDVCVLCNILYFTARKQRAFNVTDLASLDFIRRALVTGDIFRHPFLLSFYYPDPTVILYHIARLWAVFPEPTRYLPRRVISEALWRRGEETRGQLIPQLMLRSSLLKLGEAPPQLEYDMEALARSATEFPFFIAPMLAGTRSKLLNRLAAWRLFQVDYRCDAYFFALAVEYETLRQKDLIGG
ncbi:MAG: hypothetical protein AAF597_04020 [Bacteroidota bacterium]